MKKSIMIIISFLLSINIVYAENIDFNNLLKKELKYENLLSIVICSKREENYCTSRRVNVDNFDYQDEFQKYEFPEKKEKIVPQYILLKKYPNEDSLMLAVQFKYIIFRKKQGNREIYIPEVDTVNLARRIEEKDKIYEFNLEEYYGFFYLN